MRTTLPDLPVALELVLSDCFPLLLPPLTSPLPSRPPSAAAPSSGTGASGAAADAVPSAADAKCFSRPSIAVRTSAKT